MDYLFDIGRVLLNFDFQQSLRELTADTTPETHDRLLAAIDDRIDFESGREATDAFVDRVVAATGGTVTATAFRRAWQGVFTPNPPMWEFVGRLQREGGHRLILFSNTNDLHWEAMLEHFPDIHSFDGAVLSYRIGTMKPEPGFYQAAIDTFELVPQHTRYIDDLAENIAVGERFGFQCHRYDLKNHTAFEQWLAGAS